MRLSFPRFAACALGLRALLPAPCSYAQTTTPPPPAPAPKAAPAPATPKAKGTPVPAPAAPKATPAPATPAPFIGKLSLVRYDLPIAFSDGFAPTRHPAQLKTNDDAVAWPDLTLNGQPIFRGGKNVEDVPLPLRQNAEAASPFQLPTDAVIQPGNHWLRAMDWRIGLRHLYTADGTARTSNAAVGPSGRYELWLFPILLDGEGGPAIKNVELKSGGASIFKQAGPWRSLTLLLPQNEAARPYVLAVDGRPPVTFSAGLLPVKLGSPRAAAISVQTMIPGDGPKISLRNLARPAEFPDVAAWNADTAALGKPLPPAPAHDRGRSVRRYLGAEVAASPLTIYAAALPQSVDGGFFKKGNDPDAYAALLAETGYDAVFDQVSALVPPTDPESLERRAAALARRGVRLGLQYDDNATRPALQHPNIAFFAHTLPEWHAPLYRSLSLAAQRFARLPNFAGISIGSRDAGYVPFEEGAGPIPDRTWSEGMIAFTGTAQPRVPRAPSLGPPERSYETPVKTPGEFTRYVNRYVNAYHQYGYFAEAVQEVDPQLVFTTGSFGSTPGTGGRGGWPWASLPGRVMFEGVNTQQAHDWNEAHASKPLHNVALLDRLRSYWPKKRTAALLDNFRFLFGREAFQRAYALALTRGIDAVGTNFLASAAGDTARPDVIAFQKEMYSWIHKYGGVYAHTEPEPVIGIFFLAMQALERPVLTEANPSLEKLRQASHEGKVTEALFLCHAAGWPARVITFQELMRGPLPASMKAVLFVGLDRSDPAGDWRPGMAPALGKFVARGGKILVDANSIAPIAATPTGLEVAAYVPQSNFDPTPLLIARNAKNIERLRAAMEGVEAPVAASASPTLWAIPTISGDTQYVTVVNQAFAEGEDAQTMLLPADPRATKPERWKLKGNASRYVKPQTGTLQWRTDRPIYDVRLARKVTPEEAAQVDLTKDAFRWYALPPREITAPQLTVTKGISGFYEARVMLTGGPGLGGVPIEIIVASAQDSATVFSATEIPTRLPLRDSDDGEFTITVRELLTGLSASTKVRHDAPATVDPRAPVSIRDPAALAKFGARKRPPLTIALTPEQEKDPRFQGHAKLLRAHYEKKGRAVAIGTVRPGGIVEGLQPHKSPHRFPQWRTVPSDLVLFGTTANNVLLLDQARGEILPRNFGPPLPGEAALLYTRSPFVGEFDAVNIIASDAPGFTAGVQRLLTMP